MKVSIGVLSLQGDVTEHCRAIERCGQNAFPVRTSGQLDLVDGLIIPGGESTAIARLTADNPDPIFDTIRTKGKAGMPIYGTCMGSIFLAREIEGSTQGRLSLMHIRVRRNAFGPQRFSFEMKVDIPVLGKEPFPSVFIRGPIITGAGPTVTVLAGIDEGMVMAREGNLLVTSFHPEITDDLRVHQYFLTMVKEHKHALSEVFYVTVPGSMIAVGSKAQVQSR